MKKILLLCGLAVFALVGASYGQGTIGVGNDSTTLVTYRAGSTILSNAPVGTSIGVWAGSAGSVEGSLTQVATPTGVTPQIAPIAGRFSLGTWSLGVAGGATAVVQIRGWSGAASYAAATTTPGAWAGKTAIWSQATGNATPTDLPKSILPPDGSFGAFGLTQTAVVAPEPSTIALGLLGLGAVALFRRRK